MSGPRPLPTAIKRARGNPGKRKLNEDEPQPAPGAVMPAFLSAEARRYWPELAHELEEAGVLTRLDGLALGQLCESFAGWRIASRRADKRPVFRSKSGMERRSPWFSVAFDYQRQFMRLMTEFGMTPASRSKVAAVKPSKKSNPFAALKNIAADLTKGNEQ